MHKPVFFWNMEFDFIRNLIGSKITIRAPP
jgi:hypothetical protein